MKKAGVILILVMVVPVLSACSALRSADECSHNLGTMMILPVCVALDQAYDKDK